MKPKIEYAQTKERVLIVDEHNSFMKELLKQTLKKYDNEVFCSSRLPKDISSFDYCFFINDDKALRLVENGFAYKRIVFVFIGNRHKAEKISKVIHSKKYKNIKTILVSNDPPYVKDQIGTILWFSIHKGGEPFLSLLNPLARHVAKKKTSFSLSSVFPSLFTFAFVRLISKKNITITLIVTLIIYLFMFIPPLFLTSYYTYQAAQEVVSGNTEKALSLTKQANPLLSLTEKLYACSKPIYLLFSIAQLPDDIILLNQRTHTTIKRLDLLKKNASQFVQLILNKDKSAYEKHQLEALSSSIKEQLSDMDADIVFINQKIPSFLPHGEKAKNSLLKISEILVKIKKIYPFVPELLAKGTEKKYLLLFANNMELRPGGGFIGSFGTVTFSDMTLTDLQVYDVYDADGQLVAHVKPPEPIRRYLNQPHWFLRDSAFSPDNYENYNQAKLFLDKEVQMTGFSGEILFTTTAIKNILKSFKELYLPDFGEKVTSDNFYIKTQWTAEKDFFPGSTKKKTFLSSLLRQILINLEYVDVKELGQQIVKSLDEKQIVMYFEQENVQRFIDSFYWAGRIIEPHCPTQTENCYPDYLFPYDANLGVNKTNFFISRKHTVQVQIDEEGIVRTKLNILFKNDAVQDIFPGGIYNNYFQMLLPRDSLISSIKLNDAQITDYDQEIGQFKKIGFFFEVPVQDIKEVTIEYRSIIGFKKGKGVYQLLIQKQIGTPQSDLSFELDLPPNMFLVNQNFSPLVKHNQILYNTELSTDKIFFIELLKD